MSLKKENPRMIATMEEKEQKERRRKSMSDGAYSYTNN
jgi:hypothetical protein